MFRAPCNLENSHQLNECMHQRRPNWYMNLCVHNRSPRLSYRNPRLKLSLTQKCKSNSRMSINIFHRVAHLVGDIFGFGQHFVLAGRHGSSERQLPSCDVVSTDGCPGWHRMENCAQQLIVWFGQDLLRTARLLLL